MTSGRFFIYWQFLLKPSTKTADLHLEITSQKWQWRYRAQGWTKPVETPWKAVNDENQHGR